MRVLIFSDEGSIWVLACLAFHSKRHQANAIGFRGREELRLVVNGEYNTPDRPSAVSHSHPWGGDVDGFVCDVWCGPVRDRQ
jgi:hypothetical protein